MASLRGGVEGAVERMVSLVSRRRAAAALTGLVALGAGCGSDSAPSSPSLPAPPAYIPPPPSAPVPEEVKAWLDANVHPFSGSHLSFPNGQLEFLREVVGDARIVALGENTHGTRDFFEMKARILRFLVEEMDFDTFAIEATWPEARRLDRYVRTGEGDPRELLSGLYFWTWNTESVLEMIEWMRSHNEAGGDLGFHGVDMQSPGMALHLVREYIRSVDPESEALMAERLDCLGRFANDHRGRRSSPGYRDQTDDYRTECGASMEAARRHLTEKQAEYELAGGEDAFAVTLRALRVAVQYHLGVTGEQSRDESMAENTIWLSDRIGPDGRMVLWAHNFHVSTWESWQGHYQREAFGDDMVVLGFTHEYGRLTAFRARESGGCAGPLQEFDLDDPVPDSYEAYLAGASAPEFVLDLRNLEREPGNEWLFESRLFRASGACYSEDLPERFWGRRSIMDGFDGIIHFETTRPTTVLPFRYPSSF